MRPHATAACWNVPPTSAVSTYAAHHSGAQMTIQTAEDYQAAMRRLSELGDNPAEGPDQDEFFAINAAMVEFETRNHPAVNGEADMIEVKKAIVRCDDDFERAKERITEIGNLPGNPEEEAELFGLIEAVEKWEARHEDDE